MQARRSLRRSGRGKLVCRARSPKRSRVVIVRTHFSQRQQFGIVGSELTQTRSRPNVGDQGPIILVLCTRVTSAPSWTTSSASVERRGSTRGSDPQGIRCPIV